MDNQKGSIVVVGSMNVDQIATCDRFPQDGETLMGISYAQGFGGKGANQAVMAARLGADVRFVGQVGDDDLGQATIENFRAHSVDVAGIGMSPGMPSGVAPIWVDRNGTNRILVVAGANDDLTGAMVKQRLDAMRLNATSGVSVVVAQLETPQEATLAAFRLARDRGMITVLNPAPATQIGAELIGATDWLIPNETEFELLVGCPPSEEAAVTWARTSGCGVVITLGGEGVLVADGANPPWRQPAHAVDVVDTTGAGDAFVGGFAAGMSSGMSLKDAVTLGGACGALSTTRPGTQVSYPTLDEVSGLGVPTPQFSKGS
ncbi:MAG: ribokinase [Acidimicrobiia bacterium]|nr:ribokinase [Acidimicrobiia bacterium]